MLGRPRLYTSYRAESAILPTVTQRNLMVLLLIFAVIVPQFGFVDAEVMGRLTEAVIFAIAALGINLLSGVAGQVSLGHAFFMGVGAYTSVVLGGESSEKLWGLGLPMWIWLPGAGIGAALVGILVSPAAVRVRGLYLGIVTVGLVFIGLHLSKMLPQISGGAEVGRQFPAMELTLWKGDPIISFREDGQIFGFEISGATKSYIFVLVMLVFFTILSKNLIRTRTGRAWQAIRDRDVAAEVMGINERHYKLVAFAASSFLAGVAGALWASYAEQLNPEKFDLILSIEFIAILLIGGAGTTAGILMGSFFVVLTPLVIERFAKWMEGQALSDGFFSGFWNFIVSTGDGDGGIISTGSIANGFPLPVSQLNTLVYGILVIAFLLFEPLGLFGIWIKVRNYWRSWPFSY